LDRVNDPGLRASHEVSAVARLYLLRCTTRRVLGLASWLGVSACGFLGLSGGGPLAEPEPPTDIAEAAAEDVYEGEVLVMTPEDSAVLEALRHEVREEGAEPAHSTTWAERTFEEMTVRERVGQLMMPWVLGDFAPEGSPSHDRIAEYVERQGIGGVIMSVGTPIEVAAKLNDLQRHARIPLLVGADLETGAGFRMRGAIYMPGSIELGGATEFPSLMAVGAAGEERLAYEMGRITALEARAVGIHVPFAPVLDVNNNPDNPIINVRSFGADPLDVSRMGIAFIHGVQEHGAIATGKHFPGHGDTDTDSHIALPVIRHDRERMDSVELRPFKDAIEAGMGAIMTAHISVPALNGGIREASTLSPLVMTRILRDELGFDGIVFTDAMDMAAIARRHSAGEAAVRAIEAGADVILMPPNVQQAIDGIVEAIRTGRLDEARVNTSVMRVLEKKEEIGLDADRFVALDRIYDVVGIPAHTEVADEIAERSITLLKNRGDLVPLNGTRTANVLSISFRGSTNLIAGRHFNRVMRETYPRLATLDLDADADEATYANALRRARGQNLVVVSTYSNYAGAVGARDELARFIEQLGRTGVPHVVVSFGNPYLISSFPETQAYMLAWNGSEASQRAAARALLGAFEIGGRVPTGIPPLFAIGDGLRVPMKVQAAGGS
jgi:beta-N-acetylhexosaminidase